MKEREAFIAAILAADPKGKLAKNDLDAPRDLLALAAAAAWDDYMERVYRGART